MTSGEGSARNLAADRAVELFRELRDLRTDAPMPAAPLDRLWARVIDAGILAFVWIVVGGFLIGIGDYLFSWDNLDSSSTRFLAIPDWGRASAAERLYIAIRGSLPFLLLVVGEFLMPSLNGQTIGRRFTRLYLRDSQTGGRVAFPRILLRFAVGYGPTMLLFSLSGVFFATWAGFACFALSLLALASIPGQVFFRDDHRGLHDVIAKTTVLTPRRDDTIT